jgi:hypothetical protein
MFWMRKMVVLKSCSQDWAQGKSGQALLPALLAVAAHLRARHADLDSAIGLDLLHELFIQGGLELAHFPAPQTGDVDVIAGAAALVEVLAAAQVQQVQLVNQPVALQQVQRPVHGDAVHIGINLARPLEDRAGVQMTFRAVHHFQQDPPLLREPHPTLAQRSMKAAEACVRVDSFAGGDSMCGRGGHA